MKTKKQLLEYNKKYIKLYPDKKRLWDKKYKDSHKKEVKERLKIYYEKNKEKLLEQMKSYRELHQQEIKIYQKKYRKNHKEKNNEYQKFYRIENKKQLRIKDNIYHKLNRKHYNKYQIIKRKTDINYRIKYYLRNRVRMALYGNQKLSTTMKLVSCSIEKLKQHLESQFQVGMSFSNYGNWHIDHIRPCALFDLSKPEEQKKCFHYTNLQPLWAVDNLRKGKKYE